MSTRFFRPALVVGLAWLAGFTGAASPALAQSDQAAGKREAIVAKGIAYLRERGQQEEGAFSPRIGIGVTALAATALIANGVPTNDPMVAKALQVVADSVRPDGGIYHESARIVMYETSVAMLCLAAANEDGRYDDVLAGAAKFLRGQQFTEANGVDSSDINYGGAGYGGQTRPDLSNTTFLVDALHTMRGAENDEAIQKALVFISRCQNLESELNTGPQAAKVNDGGFYYTIADGGVSSAGETPDGGLRSYGSMTYAGFKSMLHAGLDEKDPRVKAALAWIQKHYTLESNPGMGDAGLYYYYHLFAKALDAAELERLVDADGVAHDWRDELVEHLATLQSTDGSWTNKNGKWMEGDPNLATAFCLLALSYCDRDQERR